MAKKLNIFIFVKSTVAMTVSYVSYLTPIHILEQVGIWASMWPTLGCQINPNTHFNLNFRQATNSFVLKSCLKYIKGNIYSKTVQKEFSFVWGAIFSRTVTKINQREKMCHR